VDNEE
jgi:hypothetical protein